MTKVTVQTTQLAPVVTVTVELSEIQAKKLSALLYSGIPSREQDLLELGTALRKAGFRYVVEGPIRTFSYEHSGNMRILER